VITVGFVALVFTMFFPVVHAASSITLDSSGCSAIGGSWDSGTSTCTLYSDLTVNSGDSFYVPSGTGLLITPYTIENYGTISVDGRIGGDGSIANDGSLSVSNIGEISITTIFGSGTVSNDGMINVAAAGGSGTINNQGTIDTGYFTIDASGEILNYGSLSTTVSQSSNKAGGTLDNYGTINTGCFSSPNLCSIIENEVGGTFVNEASGNVENSATLTNLGTMDNYGQISNTNTFANSGTLTNEVGGVVTNEPNNPSIITNDGTINNYGQFNNYETISNSFDGTLTNYGQLDNFFDISNQGAISNSGTLSNEASGDIVSDGTITNSGVVDNSGTISNVQGTVSNTGTIDNVGLFENTGAVGSPGTLNNEGSGTITNEVGGTVNNKANGIIENYGAISNLNYIDNAGSLDDYGSIVNSGTILNTGFVSVVSSGTLTNNDLIDNGNVLSNDGTITNEAGATITSYGTIDNSGVIDNSGTIGSSGVIIDETQTIDGHPAILGVIINECGGQLLQYSGATFSGTPPSSGCTVHINPVVSVEVTSLAGGSILGGQIYNVASFGAQSSTLVPTGSVSYYLYFTGSSPSSCSGTPTQVGSSVTVQADGSVPNSDMTPALAAGNYAFQSVYTPGPGEANYSPSTSTCVSFTVSKANPSVITSVLQADGTTVITGGTVVAGTSLHDSATLSGSVSGFPITGTVTYNLYSNGQCSGAPSGQQTVTLGSGGAVPNSPAQIPGGGAYGYTATYKGDSNYNSVTGACESFNVLPQTLTDGFFSCSFGNQFGLLFPQNSKSSYSLILSIPLQFYDNILYQGTPGTSFSFKIAIPFPFVTQGAYPIQTSSSTGLTKAKCYVPSFDQSKYDTISTTGGHLSPSGHPEILLGDYGSGGNLGSTTTVTVSGKVPASGFLYIAIHLSYGLTGQTFNKLVTGSSTTGVACTTVAPCVQWTSRTAVIIGNGQTYLPFTVSSVNFINKDPGVAGVVTSAATGDPIAGVQIQVYSSSGALLATLYTDQNGYYAYSFSGPPATFTVKLPAYGISQTVKTTSNSYATANFAV